MARRGGRELVRTDKETQARRIQDGRRMDGGDCSGRHGEEGGDWTGLERPVLAGEDAKDVD